MSERERLLKHLQNLQKTGKREATLNIEWLLSIFEEPVAEKTEAPAKPGMPPNEIVLDGGTF